MEMQESPAPAIKHAATLFREARQQANGRKQRLQLIEGGRTGVLHAVWIP